MDIELLKTFLEVKNTKHFGQAAENLYLTQAAVSARVKQLEKILGTPLFTRYRNNLQLTASGKRLVNHAETMLIAWDRARTDVSLHKNQTHALALGATSGLWDLILQDALNSLHKSLTKVTLRAESHGQDVLIRRLMERTLDAALLYEPAKVTDLVSIPAADAELVFVSTIKGQTMEEAINEGHVSVDWGTAFEVNYAQHFQDLNFEVTPPVLYTTLARIALEFILFHGGSAYLPVRMIEAYEGDSLFRVEDAPVFNRPIFVCYHQDNLHASQIEKLVEVLRDLTSVLPVLPKTG